MSPAFLPGLKHTCLLVVDVQQQFMNEHTRAVSVGIQARLAQYPWVICSRMIPEPGGPMERWKQYQPVAEDRPGAALAIDISVRDPATTLVVTKTRYSALTLEAQAWLRQRQVETIHVCGLDTDLCVTRTVHDVLDFGFRPGVVASLCASWAGEPLQSHGLIVLKRLVGGEQMIWG